MTALEFSVDGRRWHADLRRPVDLAIPLDFTGPQPRFFTDSPATAQALRAGTFTGSVASGASCNCATYTLAPHCHGTHTECVGHVTQPVASIAAYTPVAPCLALLVTVEPRPLHTGASDRVLDRAVLERAAAAWSSEPWTGFVVRTLPNEPAKRHRAYGDGNPAPWFEPAAIGWLVERAVTSLVVDLPSLDRGDDGGRLAAHRVYWGLPAGSTEVAEASRPHALVTELAYVPDEARDGLYLLDLQVPAFVTDAAPSRPVLYPVVEATGRASPA
jgi:arylformamidase